MKDQTIKEAQELRSECEKQIADILRDFEQKTGLSVKDVDVKQAENITGARGVFCVNLEIDL